ncbi:MAG: RHS repeat-associated core domain-containing protein [Phycisphaerae bacterium]
MTQYTYEERGFLETVLRTGGTGVDTYTYDAAGRPESIEFLNGAKVLYEYDEANRVEHIIHKDALDAVLYQFDYTWNLDNTLASRVETDNVAAPATVTTVAFGYDNRKRLTDESRTIDADPAVVVYDLTYTYDQLGNRTLKADNTAAGLLTAYAYDVDGTEDGDYQTHNNRLLSYSEFNPEYEEGEKPTRTVSYTYYANGHCSNIVIRDAGDLDGKDQQIARGLALYYASNGMLWRAVWETWSDDGGGGYDDHVKNAAVEFRYDSLRGRYLRRAVDPNDFYFPLETGTWTDYAADTPYGDFTLTPGEGDTYDVVEQTRYFGGLGEQTVSNGASRYYHADLVGSTSLLTDDAGDPPAAGPQTLYYTAFGEAVIYDGGESEWKVATTQPAGSPRYQYAGAHGYEADLLILEGKPGTRPIMLKHVGARWYQPDIGRFVQRDPIGLMGGLNLYLYCGGNPVDCSDPLGLLYGEGIDNWLNNGMAEVWRGTLGLFGVDDNDLAGWSDTAIVGTSVGAGVGLGLGGTYAYLCLNSTGWAQAGWNGGSCVLRLGKNTWNMILRNGPTATRTVGTNNTPGIIRTPWIPLRYAERLFNSNPSPGNCIWNVGSAIWGAL